MTYEQIAEMMEEMGLPFAYHHYAEGESPEPPFLLFLSPGENPFSADNVAYFSCKQLDIELYTDKNCRNWKNKWRQCLPSMKFITQKQNYSLIRKNCMRVLYEMEV